MESRMLISHLKETDSILSSSLFTRIRKPSPIASEIQAICPRDELNLFSSALQHCWARKLEDEQWEQLLEVSDIRSLEVSAWRWASHLGSILGFKLFCILSGSASTEGSIPRSVLSPESKAGLERVAKSITEDGGWPKIFEEAFIARWNTRKSGPAPVAPRTFTKQSHSQSTSQKVASAVAQNLMQLGQSQVSKQFGNILSNIQLAATYLSVMTLGVIDVTSDADLRSKLDQCMNDLHLQYNLSSVLQQLNLTLTEFQAPLFSALAVSPILLFRTCLLQSSRFGKNHYVSLLLSLGDIKPASLRDIENLIWKNLFQVARCQLHPEEMANLILDYIVEPSVLESFRFSNYALRQHFKQKFDPVRDHMSFFFPDMGVVVKQEAGEPSSGHLETARQTPAPELFSSVDASSMPGLIRSSGVFAQGTSLAPNLPNLNLPADLLHRLPSTPLDLRLTSHLSLPIFHSLSGLNSRASLFSAGRNSISETVNAQTSNLVRRYISRQMPSEAFVSTGTRFTASTTTGAAPSNNIEPPCLPGGEDVQQLIPDPRASQPRHVSRSTPEMLNDAAVSVRSKGPSARSLLSDTPAECQQGDPNPIPGASDSTTPGSSMFTATGACNREQEQAAAELISNIPCLSGVEEMQDAISDSEDLVIASASSNISTSLSKDEQLTVPGVESLVDGASLAMAAGTSVSMAGVEETQDTISDSEDLVVGSASSNISTSLSKDEQVDGTLLAMAAGTSVSMAGAEETQDTISDSEDLVIASASSNVSTSLSKDEQLTVPGVESLADGASSAMATGTSVSTTTGARGRPVTSPGVESLVDGTSLAMAAGTSVSTTTGARDCGPVTSPGVESLVDGASSAIAAGTSVSTTTRARGRPVTSPEVESLVDGTSLAMAAGASVSTMTGARDCGPVTSPGVESFMDGASLAAGTSVSTATRARDCGPVTSPGVEPLVDGASLAIAAGTSVSTTTGAHRCGPVTSPAAASHIDPQCPSDVEEVHQMTPDIEANPGPNTSSQQVEDSVFEPNNADALSQSNVDDIDVDHASAPSPLASSISPNVSPSSPHPSSHSSSRLSSPPSLRPSPCPASPCPASPCPASPCPASPCPSPALDPGHEDTHPENDGLDIRVIVRHSARIAAIKRKIEDADDTDDQAQKRVKLSKESKRNRITKKKTSRAPADDDMDVDELGDDEETEEGLEVARLVIDEDADTEFVFPPAIHVYSADCTRYFAYEGKHYNAQIARDLETLAKHVEATREQMGLPYGQHPAWVKGMAAPATISPPFPRTDADAYPIFTMTFSNFYLMSTKDMLAIFRQYPVIVVSGRPTRLRCDVESLEEWGDPDELRVMHDNSKYTPANPSAVFVKASYREFFKTSKCLNSLDNPLGGSSPAPIQLATDLHAAGSRYEGFPHDLPMQIMNWGLLAKAHAYHPPHADRPGSCTWVAIEDGLKKWDIGFPPATMGEEEAANPSAYGNGMASKRNYNRGWRWASLLLHPGTMLIMRPGVVHSVTTLQDCIALGGHFFSMPTIKYSLYSIFHTFVGSHTITNVPMDAEQQMLLRILLLWHKTMLKGQDTYLARLALGQDSAAHIPNVLNFDDFENMVMLLNYSELASIVTPPRYQHSSWNVFEQNLYRIPRECGRELRHWLHQHFELVLQPPVPDDYDDSTRLEALMLNFLVRQAHTLLDSMKRQNKLGVVGSTYLQDGEDKVVTANQVNHAIRRDLSSFPGFLSAWEKELENTPPASYCWPAAPGESCYIMKLRV